MARYSWEVKSLFRSLKKVERLMDKETDEVELARLLHYYDAMNSAIFDTFICPDVNIPLSKMMPDMFSSFLAEQRYYRLYEPLEDAIYDNLDLFNETGDNRYQINSQIAKATGVHVSKSKAISICYDFYRDLDEEIFEHFKNFYDMRYNHLRFLSGKEEDHGFLGRQHYLYGTNESFIEAVGSNDPDMSTTLIHEAAHAIDNSMNPDNYLSEDYYYEVISIFMELVSFYKKAGNFDPLFYQDSIYHSLDLFLENASDANRYSNLMTEYRNNSYKISPEFYEAIREKYKMPKKEVNEFLKSHSQHRKVYPISCALALAFFNIYKQDEKKGIENLKRFIKTVNRDDYIPLVLSQEFSNMVGNEVKSLLTEANECFEQHK